MVDLLLVNCTPSPSYRLKFGSDFVCMSASWHVTGNGLAAMYLSVRVISDKSNEVLAQRSPSMVKGAEPLNNAVRLLQEPVAQAFVGSNPTLCTNVSKS